MIFPRKRRRQADREALEALAAKIQAGVELAAAKEVRREVGAQSERIREINAANHFSEGLHRSFRSRPA